MLAIPASKYLVFFYHLFFINVVFTNVHVEKTRKIASVYPFYEWQCLDHDDLKEDDYNICLRSRCLLLDKA